MNRSMNRPAALTLATLTVAGGLATAAAPAQASTPTTFHPFVQARGRVTTTSLAVRSRATAASTRVATERKGANLSLVCSVVGQSVGGNRTWYHDASYPTSGWVSARYVTRTAGTIPACSSFPGMRLYGVTLHSSSQVNSALPGTSVAFRNYISYKLRAEQRTAFKGCPATVEVAAYWANDQAIGGVGSCGGYRTLWTVRSGSWHELGWNGEPSCTDMRRAGARHAIPGNTGDTCLVKQGTSLTEVQYRP